MISDQHLGASKGFNLQTILGRAIVQGEYETAPFPNEGQLAMLFDASRTVVREAVKNLAAKGLVSSRPKAGTNVETPDKWNLLDPQVLEWIMERPFSAAIYREFNQMRQAFEPMAAGLAAKLGDIACVREIGAHLDAMKAAGERSEALIKAEMNFHVAVLKASRNPFFWRLQCLVEAGLYSSIRLSGEAGETDIKLHEAVYTAIQDGDGPQAELAMRWLLVRAANMIEKYQPQRSEAPLMAV